MILKYINRGVFPIKSIARLLESKNIDPFITRIKILKYLIEHDDHPSVDEIYGHLETEIPTLSKTTVYNVLKLLVGKGLVRVVDLGENRHHYDANTADHGHFKCKKCGHIYDFRIDIDGLEVKDLQDFKVLERNIYFKGICPRCLPGNKRKAAGNNGDNQDLKAN